MPKEAIKEDKVDKVHKGVCMYGYTHMVHTCMSVHVCVGVGVSVHICQKTNPGVIPRGLCPFWLRQGFSLAWNFAEQAKLAGQ